jgi:hypothetical protein
MPAVSSSATSIDKKNKPAAEAPNKPTATVATSAGTLCPLCKYQFANELPLANLRQHQEGRTCMQIASTLPSASDSDAPPPSVLPASAAKVQPSVEQKEKKRKDKLRWKANAAEREAVKKEAKKLQDQAERDRLEDEKERRLAEKQHAAESDPKLLAAMCKDNKECNDPTCPDWHNCTKVNRSADEIVWECPRLLLGSPSNNTKPGRSCVACGVTFVSKSTAKLVGGSVPPFPRMRRTKLMPVERDRGTASRLEQPIRFSEWKMSGHRSHR